MLVRSSECSQQLSRKCTSRRKREAEEPGEEKKTEEVTMAGQGQDAVPFPLHKSQSLFRGSGCIISQCLVLRFKPCLPGPAQLRGFSLRRDDFQIFLILF